MGDLPATRQTLAEARQHLARDQAPLALPLLEAALAECAAAGEPAQALSVDVHAALAAAWIALGNRQAARRQLAAAVAIAPERAELGAELARLSALEHDPDAALLALKAALAAGVADPQALVADPCWQPYRDRVDLRAVIEQHRLALPPPAAGGDDYSGLAPGATTANAASANRAAAVVGDLGMHPDTPHATEPVPQAAGHRRGASGSRGASDGTGLVMSAGVGTSHRERTDQARRNLAPSQLARTQLLGGDDDAAPKRAGVRFPNTDPHAVCPACRTPIALEAEACSRCGFDGTGDPQGCVGGLLGLTVAVWLLFG